MPKTGGAGDAPDDAHKLRLLRALEDLFAAGGGRGAELADEIDDLRVELGLAEREEMK
jgi:hypothetical protein